jgi:hypothetical protein
MQPIRQYENITCILLQLLAMAFTEQVIILRQLSQASSAEPNKAVPSLSNALDVAHHVSSNSSQGEKTIGLLRAQISNPK